MTRIPGAVLCAWLAALSMSGFVRVSAAPVWSELSSGLSLQSGALRSFRSAAPSIPPGSTLTILRVNLRTARVEVVNPLHEFEQTSTFSLEALANKRHPIALLNAGPTRSFQLPLPSGLVRESGRTTSTLNLSSTGGVLCVRDRQAGIVPVTLSTPANSFSNCQYAVQAGPMLIDDGRLSSQLQDRSGKPVNRSAVAIDEDRNVLLIATDGASLYDLARVLVDASNGLKIVDALALDGSTSSGLMHTTSSPSRGYEKFGYTDSLIGSAILVFRR